MFTDRVESSLNEIINEYKAGTGLELEIHLRNVTKDVFGSLVNGLVRSKRKAEIEHSINMVSQDPSGSKPQISMIRHTVFHNGQKLSEDYVQKTRLRVPPLYVNDFMPYTVHLNRETKIRKFTSDQHAMVRLRDRISFADDKWRFDLTAVKSGEINDLGRMLKALVDQMFPSNPSPDGYLATIPHGIIDSYEVEIEYVGDKNTLTVADFGIVKTLFTLISPDYAGEIHLKQELIDIAGLIRYTHPVFKANPTLKRLANQAEALTKNQYLELYPPRGYYITEKADGVRCFARGAPGVCNVVADKLIQFIGSKKAAMTPVESPRRENSPLTPTSRSPKDGKDSVVDTTIVDGELVCHGDKCIVYVFDVLMYKQDDVTGKPFSVRVDLLIDAAKHLNELISRQTNVTTAERYKVFPKVEFVPKTFYRLEAENLEPQFRKCWEKRHPYDVDGIILTTPNDSYHDTTSYKWKPMERLTIDFVAKRAPAKMLGKKPFIEEKGKTLYLLFVGINTDEQSKLGLDTLEEYNEIFPEVRADRYHPIQFTPSSDPYAYIYQHDKKLPEIDGRIVELRRVDIGKETAHWDFVHIREDRTVERNTYYGNHFKIAEITYQNYINPFPFEELWKPTAGYFTKTADDIYKAANGYKRFVVTTLMKNHMYNVKYAIDLASGRGADLQRYHEVGVKNALFVDRDAAAISELIQRKFNIIDSIRKQAKIRFDQHKRGGEDSSTHVHTMVGDLTTDYAELVRRFEHFHFNAGVVDAVVCNFAIHYLCDTSEHIRNLIKLVNTMLKHNGVFIFTTMNGGKIFDLLKPLQKGESWILKEGNITKYELRRQYKEDRLGNVGQTIAVRLPLADELYEEPLCNIDYLMGELKKHGFAPEVSESFSQLLPNFQKIRRDMYERLSPEDQQYIGLHEYVVVRKIKDFK